MKNLFSKIFLVFCLSTFIAAPAHAGKQPKWDEFYSVYSQSLKKVNGDQTKTSKLNAIRKDVYSKMSNMDRLDFYKYADSKKEEMKEIAK